MKESKYLVSPIDTKHINGGADISPLYLRLLAYLVSAGTFVVGIYTGLYDKSYFTVVGVALIFPVLSHWLTQAAGRPTRDNANAALLLSDAFMAGLAVVMAKFSLVPSSILGIMTSATVMTVIGVRGWVGSMIALGMGIGIGSLFFSQGVHLDSPALVSVVAMIGVFIYISVTGSYAHQQTDVLIRAQQDLIDKQTLWINISQKVSKYLPPQIRESIFKGEKDVKLETQRKKLTIFFSDIKGFSQISESLQPETLTELLNNYFTEMAQIADQYGGTIDKFVGDAIMIFFGDPKSDGAANDALACVNMALEMRKRMVKLQQQWSRQGIQNPLQIRMGVNTGYCTVGNFGADDRMDYTIIGKEVNLASRLESVAESGKIFISNETHALIKDKIMCRARGSLNVKGFSKPVAIFEVVGRRKDLGAQTSYEAHDKSGFSLYVDLAEIDCNEKEEIVKTLESTLERIKNKTML